MIRDRTRGRLLKDERRRQRHASERTQLHRELRRCERVDARLHQRRVRTQRGGGTPASKLAHHLEHRGAVTWLASVFDRRMNSGLCAAQHRELAEASLCGIRHVAQERRYLRMVNEAYGHRQSTHREQLCREACNVRLLRDACHSSQRATTP